MLLGSVSIALALLAGAFVFHSTTLGVLAGAAILLLMAFLTMTWWMPRRWYRAIFYPGGRPRRMTRFINSEGAWLSSRGILPEFMVMFEVRGRRSGRTLRIPLVVATLDGNRYLVSMLGENVDWVRNVRAANGEAVLRHGPVEEVSLREIPVAERAPILKAYLARAPGGRPHFDIDQNAPLSEFERVAPRYPVFEVLPRRPSA
jgi:deazaflavin-dependent oxidoreductase (nitroreductase family)